MLPSVDLAGAAPIAAARQAPAIDSVVLERTSGFSDQPAYRVSVSRTGVVRFARQQGYRNPAGARAGTASVSPATVRRLFVRVVSSGLATMPADILGDRALCPARRTDAASAIIAVYRASGVQRVDVYLGCRAAPGAGFVPRVQRVVTLADEIDLVAGTHRWLGVTGRDG